MTFRPARAPRRYEPATRPDAPSIIGGVRGRRWIIYVRQSKKKRLPDGSVGELSREIQESACREAIKAVDAAPESIDVILDIGRRGGHGQRRPGQERMMALVESRRADAVMAFKAARIGRDIEESEHLWNRCVAAGAFISAADCLDLSNDVHRSVHWAMAQSENKSRSDYARAIVKNRRERGLPPVKPVTPFGVRFEGNRLVHVSHEWAIVDEVFRRYDAGETMGMLARDLTRRGARRRNGSTRWTTKHVSRLLYSTWHVGQLPDKGSPNGFWDIGQQLLDVDLWDRVHARLISNSRTKLHLSHAMSGLLFCGICESWSAMTLCHSSYTHKDGVRARIWRYRCGEHVADPLACPGQSILATRSEEILVASLQGLIGSEELALQRLRRNAAATGDHFDGEARRLLGDIHLLKDKQQALWDRRETGEVIPDWIYNREMSQFDAAIRALEVELDRVRDRRLLTSHSVERLQADLGASGPLTAERWFGLPESRRNEFLRAVFPFGVFVRPPREGTRPGDATGRLAVRRRDDHDDAQRRKRLDCGLPAE